MSDFITPSFCAPIHAAREGEPLSYSVADNITAPYGLAPAGSKTFLAPDDRAAVHLIRDAGGRHRSSIFYLKDPFRDPLPPWVTALIGRRRKLTRLNRLINSPGPGRTQEFHDEELQNKRADVLRSHLALLGKSASRPVRAAVEQHNDGDAPVGGSMTLRNHKGSELLPEPAPLREKITLNLVDGSCHEQPPQEIP